MSGFPFFCRLGFLIDFLSHAAVVGFMAGAAITIALQQLKGLLGIKKFTTNTDIISVMKSVFAAVHHGVSALSNTGKLHLLYFALSYYQMLCFVNSGTGRLYSLE